MNISPCAFPPLQEIDTPLNVCLTGAAGQIAYALLPYLLNGAIFGPHVRDST